MTGRAVLQVRAFRPEDGPEVRLLLQEYARSLTVDLCNPDFEAELKALPGIYAPPRGQLFLAMAGDAYAGCCALRPLDTTDYPNAGEMKRLFVRPEYRGNGVGRMLVEAVLNAAYLASYDCILLDTLDDMEAARSLYQEMGFEEVPPYYFNPFPGAHYLKADL